MGECVLWEELWVVKWKSYETGPILLKYMENSREREREMLCAAESWV